jgi:hypothetical protein
MEPFGHFVLTDLKCPKAKQHNKSKNSSQKAKISKSTKETLSFLKQKKVHSSLCPKG